MVNSTAASASMASARNLATAACSSRSASTDLTSAVSMPGSSALLQVVFDPLGLPQQEGDVLGGRLNKTRQHLHRLVELLGELGVLLVAPGVAEADHLAVQGGQAGLQVGVEALQVVGEAAQLRGVNDGLRHGRPHTGVDGNRGPAIQVILAE